MRLFLAFFLIFITSCVTPPPPPPPPVMDTVAETPKINTMLDNWHQAAAVADEEVFFGLMTEDAVYLGTDATERWLKPDFMQWSAEFFNRDTAWAFTSHNRHIYFSEDGFTAWFEEGLNTGMGPCRGSGVLTIKDGQWRIAHYNLALTIANDDLYKVQEAIKKDPLDPTEDE